MQEVQSDNGLRQRLRALSGMRYLHNRMRPPLSMDVKMRREEKHKILQHIHIYANSAHILYGIRSYVDTFRIQKFKCKYVIN